LKCNKYVLKADTISDYVVEKVANFTKNNCHESTLRILRYNAKFLFYNLRVAQVVKKFIFLYKTVWSQPCTRGSYTEVDYSNLQTVFYSFWNDLYVLIPSTSRSDK